MELYQFPEQAKVDRLIPKNKFYAEGKASSHIEQLFVDQVQSIRWAYKLAPSTVNMANQPDLQEIQIFRIDARVSELSEDIYRYIDKLILMPIIFEVHAQDQVKLVATYKRLNQSHNGKVVLGRYYSSDWLRTAERQPLPLFLNLADLYDHLIGQLLPVVAEARVDGEFVALSTKLAQAEQLLQLERQLSMLKNKLKQEKQFNRKAEINQQIQSIQTQIQTFKI